MTPSRERNGRWVDVVRQTIGTVEHLAIEPYNPSPFTGSPAPAVPTRHDRPVLPPERHEPVLPMRFHGPDCGTTDPATWCDRCRATLDRPEDYRQESKS